MKQSLLVKCNLVNENFWSIYVDLAVYFWPNQCIPVDQDVGATDCKRLTADIRVEHQIDRSGPKADMAMPGSLPLFP